MQTKLKEEGRSRQEEVDDLSELDVRECSALEKSIVDSIEKKQALSKLPSILRKKSCLNKVFFKWGFDLIKISQSRPLKMEDLGGLEGQRTI